MLEFWLGMGRVCAQYQLASAEGSRTWHCCRTHVASTCIHRLGSAGCHSCVKAVWKPISVRTRASAPLDKRTAIAPYAACHNPQRAGTRCAAAVRLQTMSATPASTSCARRSSRCCACTRNSFYSPDARPARPARVPLRANACALTKMPRPAP